MAELGGKNAAGPRAPVPTRSLGITNTTHADSASPISRARFLDQQPSWRYAAMQKYLREWRQDAINKHQYDTAIYVADKLLALSGARLACP